MPRVTTFRAILDKKFASVRDITFLTPDEQRILCDHVQLIADKLDIRGNCGDMHPRDFHKLLDSLRATAAIIERCGREIVSS